MKLLIMSKLYTCIGKFNAHSQYLILYFVEVSCVLMLYVQHCLCVWVPVTLLGLMMVAVIVVMIEGSSDSNGH